MIPTDMLSEALRLYRLKQPRAELIRHNENMTYKVTTLEGQYVLRIHKPVEGFSHGLYDMGHSRIEFIKSELDLVSALKNGADMSLQTPVCGIDGGFVQVLTDEPPVTLLEWVEGQTVERAGLTPEVFRDNGRMMAKMHAFFSSQAEIGKSYRRYSYDQTILPRIAERIEGAERANIVKPEQARTILKSLAETKRRFDELDGMREKHIVHADLSQSNVIVASDGRLTPIDFSLCGYSHFYMDIGVIFGLNRDDEGRLQIIEGYKSVRDCEINPRYVEPYFALGVVLFIACQYERAPGWDWFPDRMERWCRDIFQPLADRVEFITA